MKFFASFFLVFILFFLVCIDAGTLLSDGGDSERVLFRLP